MSKVRNVKKKSSTKAERMKCADCGNEYDFGAPHRMFCPAHTCDVCGNSYGYVVMIQDRQDAGKTRVCENCVVNGL
jgi:DNA-directed RNA polymerase subunit M/transcription elongation factor TFIIS